jgi:hypothetical protein
LAEWQPSLNENRKWFTEQALTHHSEGCQRVAELAELAAFVWQP